MIAIAGGKGGCGKTTATLGVARALARAGCDPLVVDADTDLPDLHLVADVEREPTATAVARGRPPTTVCHRSAAAAGIAVLPAGSPESTPAALSRLQDWHGPVLVDCPAGAGRDATVPMRYSDGTVVVTGTNPETLGDAAKTASMARRLDSPVVATILRGAASGTELPFRCRRVERIPRVASSDGGPTPEQVLAHPQVRAACASVSKVILRQEA